jgi:gamma-glutamylcyclotransferase (GGCT)/AIG2-like uncharacterized protein YtfP
MPTSPTARDSATATQHLFAYGSLVDPRCLEEVLGHAHSGERLRAQLVGYERKTEDVFPYPFIVAASGGCVDGVLVMDLSTYDMQLLDGYEEIETGMYRRQLVDVEAWGCGLQTLHMQAYTYVAGPGLIVSTAS